MTCAAIIVAAGKGKRFGGRIPKQFLPLNGKPLFLWGVQAFRSAGGFSQIVVVVPASHAPAVETLAQRHHFDLVAGGAERYDSVKAGLAALKPGISHVAIHDGARPLISPGLIRRTRDAARKSGAAIAAVPARDTIKAAAGTRIERTLDRSRIWLAQTPQVFRRDVIEKAYRRLAKTVTDDAQAVEALGRKVTLVMGDYRNIKITSPHDLAVARLYRKEGTTL